jgi:hypothetical protein
MRCSNCGSENSAGKKFCAECGAGLSRGCPQCAAENAPAARFCGDCGAAPVQPREATGERRHLTVLFCDLVGSGQARPPRRSARDARGNLGWFTEGFDTADLKDAKALLDQLSG